MYFACPNGHPYRTNNSGWPTEVSCCLDCSELIGGHGQKLLSTNWRIKKHDFELLTAQRDNASEPNGLANILAGVERIPVPDQKSVNPDAFDPVSLKLKTVAIPLGPSEHSVAQVAETEHQDFIVHSGQKVILCFGDSLTAGLTRKNQPYTPYTVKLQQILASRLCDDKKLTKDLLPRVVNAGVCNEKSHDMCLRWKGVLRDFGDRADYALILGGTNDLEVDRPTYDTIGNLKELHLMAHQAGIRTGVLTVPDCREGCTLDIPKPLEKELKAINDELRAFAELNPKKTFLADVAAKFPQDASHADLWEEDHVHFSAKGYDELGIFLATLLLKEYRCAETVEPLSRCCCVE